MDTVAAIIPVYNRAHCVGEAIESVLAQTRLADEVIVVDDGSTDDTPQVVRSFGERVQYIRQPNSGQGIARNRAALVARSAWLAFLDSDDIWLPDKLQRHFEATEDSDAPVHFHDYGVKKYWCDLEVASWNAHCAATLGVSLLTTGEVPDPFEASLIACHRLSTCSLFVRRDIFLWHGGYRAEYRRCQDVDLHLRFGLHEKLYYINEPLFTVRQHARNAAPTETHLRMAEIFRHAAVACEWRGQKERANHLFAEARRQVRAIGGAHRRHGQLLKAARAYLASVCLR